MQKFAVVDTFFGKVTGVKENKLYPMYNVQKDSFNIKSEDGNEWYCLNTRCSHLNGGDWVVVTSEKELAFEEIEF